MAKSLSVLMCLGPWEVTILNILGASTRVTITQEANRQFHIGLQQVLGPNHRGLTEALATKDPEQAERKLLDVIHSESHQRELAPYAFVASCIRRVLIDEYKVFASHFMENLGLAQGAGATVTALRPKSRPHVHGEPHTGPQGTSLP